MRASERGYNMVMLVMAITVLNIMVAISLPMWSQMIQRDKEEELISRGFQYVEAVRVFQNRFQRLPVRLEELIEVKPRCIRRLWKDPMTDEKMQPIFQNEGQPLVAQTPDGQTPEKPASTGKTPGKKPGEKPGGKPGGKKPVDPDDEGHMDKPSPPNEGPALGPDGKPQVTAGPIVGVRSRSNKKSILVFNGKERYDEWRFTIEMMLQAGAVQGQTPQLIPPPGAAAGLNLSTRWIGRPLPAILGTAGTVPGGRPLPPGGPAPQPPGGRGPGGGGRGPAGGKLPRGGAQL